MENPTREDVKEFYSEAADKPREDLCCPTSYPQQNLLQVEISKKTSLSL